MLSLLSYLALQFALIYAGLAGSLSSVLVNILCKFHVGIVCWFPTLLDDTLIGMKYLDLSLRPMKITPC